MWNFDLVLTFECGMSLLRVKDFYQRCVAVNVELTAFCEVTFTIQLRGKVALSGLDTLPIKKYFFYARKTWFVCAKYILRKTCSCYHPNCNYPTIKNLAAPGRLLVLRYLVNSSILCILIAHSIGDLQLFLC